MKSTFYMFSNDVNLKHFHSNYKLVAHGILPYFWLIVDCRRSLGISCNQNTISAFFRPSATSVPTSRARVTLRAYYMRLLFSHSSSRLYALIAIHFIKLSTHFVHLRQRRRAIKRPLNSNYVKSMRVQNKRSKKLFTFIL